MFRLLAPILLALCALPAPAQEEEKKSAEPDKLFHPLGLPVGDFQLSERGGDDVSPRSLLGKIWVAQFFFPNCNLCSRNTPTMVKLQERYRGKADVRLVSFDLIDSPKNFGRKTLDEFAASYDAEAGQWLFVTGPEEKVHRIAQTCFYKMVLRNPAGDLGAEVLHDTHLVLIDWNGNMVGYVDGVKPKAAETLVAEIDRLRTRRRMEERIPITGADMPWFNAMLNSSCTVLLLLGWILIRMRYETLHKIVMLLALAVSAVFLASYLYYHFVVMEMEPTRFQGEGMARYVYFAILLSHTILAIAVAPLALTVAVQGLRDSRKMHVRLARWTLPIWLYVSVTGVVVYWMLYRVEW